MHRPLFLRVMLAAVAGCAVSASLTGCSKNGNNGSDSDQQDYYHADRDIAMTLGSILDAVRVGEPLDSTVYNFVGVLTDGEGAPIYTDRDYYPGQWEVMVVTPDSAVVRNLNSGNIMVADLKNYIADNLDLDDDDICDAIDFDNDDIIEETVYSFEGGLLRFKILEENTPLDQEGPFLCISVSKH